MDKVVEYVKGLQQEDGSFAGDKWGKDGISGVYCDYCRLT